MNLRAYVFGLAHAVAVGAMNAIVAEQVYPEHFSGNWKKLAIIAGWGAIIAAYLYLKQPPRIKWTKEQRDAKG